MANSVETGTLHLLGLRILGPRADGHAEGLPSLPGVPLQELLACVSFAISYLVYLCSFAIITPSCMCGRIRKRTPASGSGAAFIQLLRLHVHPHLHLYFTCTV